MDMVEEYFQGFDDAIELFWINIRDKIKDEELFNEIAKAYLNLKNITIKYRLQEIRNKIESHNIS